MGGHTWTQEQNSLVQAWSRMNAIVPFLALANGGHYEQDGMGGDNSPHLLKVSNEFTKKTYRIDTCAFACARCFNC